MCQKIKCPHCDQENETNEDTFSESDTVCISCHNCNNDFIACIEFFAQITAIKF